jgi:hypothetical protein
MTFIETDTVSVTIIGTTWTLTHWIESVVEIESVTVGRAQYPTISQITVFIPAYITVRSHVVSRINAEAGSPAPHRLGDGAIVGIATGAATAVALIVGIAVFLVRSGTVHSDSRNGSTPEGTRLKNLAVAVPELGLLDNSEGDDSSAAVAEETAALSLLPDDPGIAVFDVPLWV